MCHTLLTSISAFPLKSGHRDSKPTHVEMCLVSNITWSILPAKTCPMNVVTAEADHLLTSWLFWISREGNHRTAAMETTNGLLIILTVSTCCRGTSWSYQISDCMLYSHVAAAWQRDDYPWNIFIIRAKSTGAEIRQRFQVRTSSASVHLCLNKYSALPVVINLDCCVKTIICRPYGNVISQASEKSRGEQCTGSHEFSDQAFIGTLSQPHSLNSKS